MKRNGFSLTEMSIVAAVIGLVAAIAAPNYVKAKNAAMQNACIMNLREIEGAVQVWAMDTGQPLSATPAKEQLVPDYIKKWPVCKGAAYAAPAADTAPVCPNSIPGHVLVPPGAGS